VGSNPPAFFLNKNFENKEGQIEHCRQMGFWQKLPSYPGSQRHSSGLVQYPCSEHPGNLMHSVQFGPNHPGKQLKQIKDMFTRGVAP
jgi:hypothetical protein